MTTTKVLCLRVRIMWACHPESTRKKFQRTIPLNFQSIRAVQQWHNSNSSGTTQVNLATLIFIGTPVFPLQLATPPGFHVIHIPKGNPVYMYICSTTRGCRQLCLLVALSRSDRHVRTCLAPKCTADCAALCLKQMLDNMLLLRRSWMCVFII